jgi:choline dehydrogenase
LDRPNLHILTSAQTMRLIIDEDTKTVTGVVIRRGKNREELEKSADEVVSVVKHKGEVIVSAGALATPQILQLSGIGPRKMLENVGVKCIADLPVGLNLQDHISTPVYFSSKIPTLSPRDLTPENLQKWAVEGRGALQSAAVECFLFYNSGLNQSFPKPLMDMQYHVCCVTGGADLANNFNVRNDVVDALMKYLGEDKHSIVIMPTLLHPDSVGTVGLQSSNPLDYPLIDPNYLDKEIDLEISAQACMKAYQICMTEPLKSNVEHLGEIMCPEIKGNPATDIEYWRQWVRYFGVTLYHPTSTCKMGRIDDPTAVVTPDCRVKGITNLRVVDASVMPEVCSGNTNIPVICIGERASDIITSGERITGTEVESEERVSSRLEQQTRNELEQMNIRSMPVSSTPTLTTGNIQRQPSF